MRDAQECQYRRHHFRIAASSPSAATEPVAPAQVARLQAAKMPQRRVDEISDIHRRCFREHLPGCRRRIVRVPSHLLRSSFAAARRLPSEVEPNPVKLRLTPPIDYSRPVRCHR